MALGEYTDVYNLADYKTRVNNIVSELNSEESGLEGLKQSIKVQMNSQINMLRKKEEIIYRLLGCNSKQEMEDKIKGYQEAYFPLTGQNLYQACIAHYDISFDKEQLELQKQIDALTEDIIQENGGVLAESSKEEINKLLIENLNTSTSHFSSTKGYSAGRAPDITKITKQQKKAFEDLLKNPKYSYLKGKATVSMNKDSLDFGYSWYENTQGLTKEQARERFRSGSPELQNINNNILQRIGEYCGKDAELIKNIIREKILSRDEYAFFVGQNSKDITGILGEIQGIYYLSKLLSSSGNTANISWQGGIQGAGLEKGQKPHVDILLKDIGIQVKNTTRELVDNFQVNFASASINTMLSKIPSSSLSNSSKNLIINYYGTKMFNVPWVRGAGGVFEEKEAPENSEFRSFKSQLEACNSDIESLLELFGAIFMYLDVSEGFDKTSDLNNLYILGASTIVVASEILQDMLVQLNNGEKSFSISGEPNRSLNIVDVLNSSEDVTNLLRSTKQKTVSDTIISNIVLTSSFNFKI